MELDELRVDARRDAHRWKGRAHLTDVDDATALVVDVDADLRDDEMGVVVSNVEGELGGQSVALSGPTRVTRRGSDPTRIEAAISLGEGRMLVDWYHGADRQFGNARARSFPLRHLALLFDPALDLDGTVSADIVVPDRGGTADSAAELPRASISLEGARSRARADFPGLDARVDARRAGSEIQVSGSIAPRLGGSLDVNGTIGDMQPSAFPFAGFGPKNPLHLLLVGSLGEDAVAELATFADLRFSGCRPSRSAVPFPRFCPMRSR
jgi:hypothetical protein